MIFDKFYRGQGQRYRVQGTGMGLAIAKAIVEAHGGSIDVTSQPSQGSVFSFYLPLQRRAANGYSFGRFGHVPSTTKRLDQKHARIHLPTHDVDVVPFVGQRGRLRCNNLQIGVDPANISVVEDLLRGLRRQRGLVLVFRLLAQNAQSDKVVFDLLERRQRSLPIVGNRLVVAGIGLLRDSGSSPRVEHRLR